MKKNILIYVLPALLLLLTSCSKEVSLLENNADKDAYYINLDVLGYTEKSEAISLGEKLGSASSSRLNVRNALGTLALGDDFAVLSVEQRFHKGNKKQLLASTGETNPGSYPLANEVTQMLPGTKFMVLVFDENGKHLSSTLATLGEKTQIKIEGSVRETMVKHRIVAFSYNDGDASGYPELNPATTNDNPTINVPVDKELLYSNNLIDIDMTAANTNENPTAVQVLFYQQTAKVGIVVDARGMFSKVKRVMGTYTNPNYFKTGVLDLKGNSIGSLAAVPSTSLDFGDFNAGVQDTAVFYRYSVVAEGQTTISDFGVKISELVIDRNGTENTLIASNTVAKSYDFGAVPIAAGTQTNVRVNLLEGFRIGNIMWAKANLYYDTQAQMKYKFRQFAYEGMGEVYKNTDFWRPDNLLPTMDGGIGDPCSQVYPKGWRLPTENEALLLINNAYTGLGLKQEKDNNTNGRSIKFSHIDVAKVGELTFYSSGYYSAVGVLTTPDLFAGFLTSNRPAGNDLSVLVFTTPDVGGSSTDVITYYGNVGSRRYNIRCVRAVN